MREEFKGKAKIYFLTKEIIARWKSGELKKSWLNYFLKVPYVAGISGDYVYWIRVMNPKQVSFSSVPDFYKEYVNPKRKIWEYDATLEKIEPRQIREKRVL